MNVGSLYYVDAAVKDFKAICHAEKADLDGAVVSSRSWEMEESLERKGRFATGVQVDVGWLLNGGVDKDYVVKVHSSLTDVVLEEIPLGPNWTIFAKLMEKPQCSQVAMQYIHAGGYVCQGQKILQATAEFKLDRDAQSKLATKTKATADNIKDIVKLAVESQSDQSVVDKEGRLFAGTALKYGVSMNPICLAPPNGRFQRVLPRTALGRVTNFVLYNVVEPILPARPTAWSWRKLATTPRHRSNEQADGSPLVDSATRRHRAAPPSASSIHILRARKHRWDHAIGGIARSTRCLASSGSSNLCLLEEKRKIFARSEYFAFWTHSRTRGRVACSLGRLTSAASRGSVCDRRRAN
jgi:hypothetical protein